MHAQSLDAIAAEAAGSGSGGGGSTSADYAGLTQAALAAAQAEADAAASTPPKQLQLKDLSVKQLRVLIKALGNGGALDGVTIVEKRELVSLAFSTLADAPLALIDEVTNALGVHLGDRISPAEPTPTRRPAAWPR